MAAACALLGPLAGCGGGGGSPAAAASPSPTPVLGPGIDFTNRTITLLALTDLSGPNARAGTDTTSGQQAYFERLDDSGGIYGWRVLLHAVDTRSDPRLAAAYYNRLEGAFTFVAQALGAPVAGAIESAAVRDGVLVGTVTQDISYARATINAVLGPPYAADTANALSLVRPAGRAAPRVALVYDPDPYGQQAQHGFQVGVDTYRLPDAGQLAYRAPAAGLIASLRRAGAATVYLATTPAETAAVLGAAQAAGYHPHWLLDEHAWSTGLLQTDGPVVSPTKIAAELRGAEVVGYQAPWGDIIVPGMKDFLATQQVYAPTQQPSLDYIYGYCLAGVERNLLSHAIVARHLSRAGVLAAKRTFGNVDLSSLMPSGNYGPVGGPVTLYNDVFVVDPSVPGLLRVVAPYFESLAATRLGY